MKITVLGGSGFLGRHLCRALAGQGHELCVLSRQPKPQEGEGYEWPKLNWVVGDLRSKDDLRECILGSEVVYHLANSNIPSKAELNPIEDVQTNLLGTLNVLEVIKECEVKKLIFASSGGTVYGEQQVYPISENQPTNPISIYGVNKLACEKYIAASMQALKRDYCILRIANPYGELQSSDRQQGAIAVFSDLALNHKPIKIWGDGEQVRDYIHVSDVVSALLASLDYFGETRVFNIGCGEGVSLNGILKIIEKNLGYELNIQYLPPRNLDVLKNYLNIDLAFRCLGWQPKVTLSHGINAYLETLKGS